jgi:ketosteroid isomerase-like protein
MKNILTRRINLLRIAPLFAGVFLSILLLLGGNVAVAQRLRDSDRDKILSVMAAQEAAWNSGDLDGFMEGYWQDDSLRFIGKSGITYGWQPTLDNYRKGYPDKAAMGKLTFTILRVEALGKDVAHVTGRWHLQRQADAPQGYFTLLWRKIGGQWVIVADHSS